MVTGPVTTGPVLVTKARVAPPRSGVILSGDQATDHHDPRTTSTDPAAPAGGDGVPSHDMAPAAAPDRMAPNATTDGAPASFAADNHHAAVSARIDHGPESVAPCRPLQPTTHRPAHHRTEPATPGATAAATTDENQHGRDQR